MPGDLSGKVALVAGATRGAGRAIAVALGERGATVICTGRSTRAHPSAERPEVLEDTAERVTAAGGRGVAVRCDHADDAQVAELFARVGAEHGRLDVLVNDLWGGEALVEWGVPLAEVSVDKARRMFDNAVWTHLSTARHAAPLLTARPGSLLVEVTDGDSFGYRGTIGYDLTKMAVIRLAFALGKELGPQGGTAVSITPGFLRSEAMLDLFGVSEANWRDAVAREPDFIASESPTYVGRAVAALAADPDHRRFQGRVLSSWGLARVYGFTDADGSRPMWDEHFARAYGRLFRVADAEVFAAWEDGPYDIVMAAMSAGQSHSGKVS